MPNKQYWGYIVTIKGRPASDKILQIKFKNEALHPGSLFDVDSEVTGQAYYSDMALYTESVVAASNWGNDMPGQLLRRTDLLRRWT